MGESFPNYDILDTIDEVRNVVTGELAGPSFTEDEVLDLICEFAHETSDTIIPTEISTFDKKGGPVATATVELTEPYEGASKSVVEYNCAGEWRMPGELQDSFSDEPFIVRYDYFPLTTADVEKHYDALDPNFTIPEGVDYYKPPSLADNEIIDSDAYMRIVATKLARHRNGSWEIEEAD